MVRLVCTGENTESRHYKSEILVWFIILFKSILISVCVRFCHKVTDFVHEDNKRVIVSVYSPHSLHISVSDGFILNNKFANTMDAVQNVVWKPKKIHYLVLNKNISLQIPTNYILQINENSMLQYNFVEIPGGCFTTSTD